MRQYLILLLTCVFLVSCKQSKELEGLWFIAYSKISDGEPDYSYERNLLHFDGDKVYTIRVGDFASWELNKVSIDTAYYQISDTTLNLWGEKVNCIVSTDSIVLTGVLDSVERMMVLFPVKSESTELKADIVSGAWGFEAFGRKDTIAFINDSILIHTGDLNVISPIEGWSMFSYYELNFFLLNNGVQPWLAPIAKYAGDTILFENEYRPTHEIKMYKVKPVSREDQLLGTWRQGPPDSVLKFLPPPPPGMTEADRPINMTFDTDSVTITKWGRGESLKWDITADGKRVYFIDKIDEKWGSGKIVRLTDDQLFLRMAGDVMEGDTLKLFRVQ